MIRNCFYLSSHHQHLLKSRSLNLLFNPSVSFSPRSSQHSSSKNPDEESVELVQEADLLSQMDEFSTDLTLAQAHREVLQDLDEAREHNNQLERDLLQTQTEAEELRNQVKELQVELEAVRKSNQGLMMHVTELEQDGGRTASDDR